MLKSHKSYKKSIMTTNHFFSFLLTFFTLNYSEYKYIRRHILIDNTIIIFNV
jgi:hypothetical protein